MTTSAQLRSHYARNSVTTASPVRLVTMLYDRLARDIDDAEFAIEMANPQSAHNALRHAQDIVQELANSLDVSRWSGAEGLKQLYTWLTDQLVAANSTKDASLLAGCREVIEPLREAWHDAANSQSVAS